MKAKVLIPFTDKVTKKKYAKGQIIELTAERFNEISAYKGGKLIEAAEETKANTKEEK